MKNQSETFRRIYNGAKKEAIPLEEINIIGHKFTKDFHQPIPHNETMEEIHKDIA